MSTNRLNKIVVGLCDLSKEGGNLRLRLLRLLKANFPDDRKLLESLMEVDLYHQRHHLAKLSLVILEEHRTRETINFDDAQVEHIMPQRLNAEWRLQVANADKVKEQYGSTLGNLTLTKYNQEMSNKPYSEKKEFYKDSNVSLTREVAETYNQWGKEAIIDRTKELIDELIQIFPMPNIKEVNEEEIAGEYTIDQTVNVTGKAPVQITINENEYPVKTWKQMLKIFLNDLWNRDSLNYDRIKENNQISRMLFRPHRRPATLENGTVIETNFSASVILANILLIKNQGTMGAVIATVLAETCITLIDLFFVSKAIPNFSGLSGKWKYILAGATTFGIIRCINYKLPGTFVSLLFQGVICVMVYFAICVATSSSFTNTIIRTIKQRKATN
ncbi:GmrSD restriction endonuclease domain-containing protein [Fructilactobacillus sanfranciscensis]|uniref:GmrSD restriction endonuclease domain-containing protein n=1 Tax=Fructilactobacillus sanfranciscensis TaxID=1625 RepID=UPI0023AA45AB|nr:DUF1524 domain-containing protein [Fructilactobacillus sanfranciscensis]WED57548.1 DUF1524 domain-containing protein [Fructilactobacillus sanfranciscensis]